MLYPDELRALIGRGGEIRTPDILLPKQARYQTALHPVTRPKDRAQIILGEMVKVNNLYEKIYWIFAGLSLNLDYASLHQGYSQG